MRGIRDEAGIDFIVDYAGYLDPGNVLMRISYYARSASPTTPRSTTLQLGQSEKSMATADNNFACKKPKTVDGPKDERAK
jgi:hypothetical protein